MMQIMGDGNAIYLSATGPFNIVRRNYVHDIFNCVAAIRTDGWQKDTQVTENIVYKCSGGIQRKNYNHIENNIIADLYHQIDKKMMEHEWGISYVQFKAFPQDERTFGARVQRNICYHLRGPGQFYGGIMERRAGRNVTIPEDTKADFNLFYNAADSNEGPEFIASMQKRGIDAHSISADPLFVDLENGDFRLKPNSPALKLGFKPIDITKIGLTNDFPKKFRDRIQ